MKKLIYKCLACATCIDNFLDDNMEFECPKCYEKIFFKVNSEEDGVSIKKF